MDHPSAHLFGRWLDRSSAARRGSAAHHASAGQVRWVCGADDDTYFKKENRWSSGPVQLDHPGWRRKVAQSHLQAISGRRPLDHPPRSSVVQPGPVGSRVVQPGQGGPAWSSLVQGGPGWSRQRGVGGAQPIIPERCAIDAQCDSASIGRVWAGAACMQPGLSWVGRRPGHSYVSTYLSTHI